MPVSTSIDLPAAVDGLTAEWLTVQLRAAGTLPGTDRVLRAQSAPLAEGVGMLSYIHRLTLELDGPGPTTMIAKLPTDTAYRQLADITGAYAREVDFYTTVAPLAPLRTPEVYLALDDPESGNFVLLLEDLGHLDAGDHVAGLSFERAERVLDELARFHAWGWDLGPAAARHSGFADLQDATTVGLYTMGIQSGWAVHEAHGRMIPGTDLAAFVSRYAELLPGMLAALASPPTLLNGDLRADNLFFDDAGSPTTVDFQLVMRGAGIWDVAYLVGQGLRTEDRHGRERELVERYVRGLQAAGVSGYETDEAWRQFRIAVAAQVTFPLTAMLSWETLGERARDLVLTLAERSFSVIAETDALDVLPEVTG